MYIKSGLTVDYGVYFKLTVDFSFILTAVAARSTDCWLLICIPVSLDQRARSNPRVWLRETSPVAGVSG